MVLHWIAKVPEEPWIVFSGIYLKNTVFMLELLQKSGNVLPGGKQEFMCQPYACVLEDGTYFDTW